MLKRSKKILLEGTLAEFKNYPRGAEGREYVLMNIEEKGPDGSYAFYEKDEKGDIIPVSYKGTEGYDATEFILFTDPEFERIILANFNTNPKGGITTKEADAITNIGQLFSGNTALVTIEDLALLKNVKTIPLTAFLGCTNLLTAIIPKQITGLDNDCFNLCPNLKTVKVYGDAELPVPSASFGEVDLDCVEFYGTKTLNIGQGGHTNATSVLISNNIISIEKASFYNFTNLEDVSIPNSVTDIKESAFYGCTSLTSIVIPSNVIKIRSNAFADCTNLASVTISNGVSLILSSAFTNCIGLTSVTIPSSVTSLSGAFSGCPGLSFITVDTGNIKYDSRDNCNAIIDKSTNILILGCKNTVIPNSVTEIGYSAFSCCTSLTSVTIPGSVTKIGGNAFRGCIGLLSIELPSSVTSIEGAAFASCTNLEYIKCYRETPATISSTYYGHPFNEITSTCTLYVPINSLEAYQTANYWKDFLNIVGFEPEEETQE